MRPSHLLALAASTVLAVSVFLPWMRVGDAGLAGVPDPSGLFVLVTGVASLGIAAFGLVRGRDVRPWVMLAGLAALTTLANHFTFCFYPIQLGTKCINPLSGIRGRLQPIKTVF